ncbi:MAG: polyprenyl synthetase family protein [Verrucomicrobia bacterium]|nr:polyprenyl synthetase family protein [Verrucomicrobiota bacterium]
MFAARSNTVERAVTSARPEAPADAWKQIVEPVQPFLDSVARRLGEQVEAFDPEISAYARYALTNQGKQLRPALVALAAGATGRLSDPHATVAVIVEMVHLATLVHDDIMDSAEIRRRRPTLAANWGNSISVLVGDCLFARALQLAASFPTPVVCREVSAATNTVCSGEILQSHRRLNFAVSRADYFKVVAMKTGELFALSCDLGARLNAVPEAQRVAMRNYGLALGTAYQVYDDCLDVFGSEAEAGKSLGTDLASGKLTLPLLVVLERSEPAEREQLKEWIMTWRPHYLPRVLELLAKYGSLAESRAVIGQFLADAQANLSALSLSESRVALVMLTEFLASATEALGKKP